MHGLATISGMGRGAPWNSPLNLPPSSKIYLTQCVANDVSIDIKDSNVILMILLIHEMIADIKDSSVILVILLIHEMIVVSF